VKNNLNKVSAKVRKQILISTSKAKKGHIGGAFSLVDILVAIYLKPLINFNVELVDDVSRDRVILSKGHTSIAMYVVLHELGIISDEQLDSYGKNSTLLGEHPDHRLPGIEVASGSLGHGAGIGVGIAFGLQMDKKNNKTIVIMGDGECNEGAVWEAFMFAAHHELSNFIIIIDRNQLCILGESEKCLGLEPLEEKIKAFGFDVKSIDGHSFDDIINVFTYHTQRKSNKPLAIIANTIKGKGVSYMEHNVAWHYGVPDDKLLQQALSEIDGGREFL